MIPAQHDPFAVLKEYILLPGEFITPNINQTPAWGCDVVVELSYQPAGAYHLVSIPYERHVSSWEALFPTIPYVEATTADDHTYPTPSLKRLIYKQKYKRLRPTIVSNMVIDRI